MQDGRLDATVRGATAHQLPGERRDRTHSRPVTAIRAPSSGASELPRRPGAARLAGGRVKLTCTNSVLNTTFISYKAKAIPRHVPLRPRSPHDQDVGCGEPESGVNLFSAVESDARKTI